MAIHFKLIHNKQKSHYHFSSAISMITLRGLALLDWQIFFSATYRIYQTVVRLQVLLLNSHIFVSTLTLSLIPYSLLLEQNVKNSSHSPSTQPLQQLVLNALAVRSRSPSVETKNFLPLQIKYLDGNERSWLMMGSDMSIRQLFKKDAFRSISCTMFSTFLSKFFASLE